MTIKTFFFLSFYFCVTSYKAQNLENNALGQVVFELDPNIRSIFQDKSGVYWFGTNNAGVYRYEPSNKDGKTLIQFTEKDGLTNNQIQSIQEDENGNLWFGTGMFGVSKFDTSTKLSTSDKTFTTLTSQENIQITNPSSQEWKTETNDLWFYAGGGVFRYNANSFVYLPLGKSDGFSVQNSPFNLSRYAVYCMLKDSKGNLWFGTQSQGVCRYSDKSVTWFTEKGLLGPAVLALFEDSKGNIWFGNNGAGLFLFDGKNIRNFTEEKGLSNDNFRLAGKEQQGTLARIYAINEDQEGNIWIGTVDSGVWKYNPSMESLTNYTIKDGLSSMAINTIYKDKNGELWFGTDEDGICKYNSSAKSKLGEKAFAVFKVR